MISKKTLEFLTGLKSNNNRPWFADNKERFIIANNEMKAFLESLAREMNKIDRIEKTKLFRIYRDVRFSKDKTPYKSQFSMSMTREKPFLRGGYYLRITPGESIVACGFWNPSTSDLHLIRKNIEVDPKAFEKSVSAGSIQKIFGELEGNQVKTAPKGFTKDHPQIKLIRYKDFLFTKPFSDHEVTRANFLSKVIEAYSSIRPFFDYMSDILSHNLDGEPLY